MKKVLLKVIKDVLDTHPDVIFAYLFGSFLESDRFRDVDIGIYIKQDNNPYAISSELKERISRNPEISGKFSADFFDIQILNEAPFYVIGRIMKEGFLIIDKDPDLRKDLVEKVSLKYRECAGILKETI